jgi:hypothetical protein
MFLQKGMTVASFSPNAFAFLPKCGHNWEKEISLGRKDDNSPCLRRNHTRLNMTRQIRKLFLNAAFVPESRWQDLRI